MSVITATLKSHRHIDGDIYKGIRLYEKGGIEVLESFAQSEPGEYTVIVSHGEERRKVTLTFARDKRDVEFYRCYCTRRYKSPPLCKHVVAAILQIQGGISESKLEKIDLGKIGYSDTIVNSANVAATVESGALEVFATPAMIALMEKAACSCIADGLEAGETSVGTAVDITHMAPTPIGVKVEAEAKLGAVFGRRLEFTVTAYDCDEKGERKTQIGSGKHSRVIVDEVKFMSRLQK